MPPSSQGSLYSLLDGLARLLLLACTALLPIFVLPVQWMSLTQSKMLLFVTVIVLAALLWMGARLFEGTIRLPRGALLYAVLLLPVAYVVSTAAAGFTTTSVLGVGIEQDTLAAILLWFSAFALAALLFYNRAADIRMAIRAFAAGLTALFVFQIAYILLPSWLSLGGFLQTQTANLAGSWHDLGILAGLALFSGVMLFRTGIFADAWRILAVVLSAAALCVLILVHFTDVLWGTAALLVAAGSVAMLAEMRGGLPLMRALTRSVAPFALAVLFVLAAVFGTSAWNKLPARILITEVEVRPSWQGTFDVARQSLGAPTQLFFGTGPNTFVREWGFHKPEEVNLTPFWNADFSYGVGIIPTSVFAAGLFGLIAWSVVVLVLVGLGLRLFSDSRPLFVFLLIGSLYLVIFHMLYTPGAALTALTFLFMGLLAAVVASEKPPRILMPQSMLGSIVFALIILCAVPAVAAGGLVGREIVSNMHVNRAVHVYRSSGDSAEAGKAIGRALSLSPRNDRAHRAAAELGLVEFAALVAKGEPQTAEEIAQLQQTLQRTIQHGLTAVEIDGDNYQNWLLLAQVYGSFAGVNVAGAYEEAKSTYEKAFDANPTNPLPKLRLAQLSASRGELEAAQGYLDEALALKQDFAAAHYLRSQIEASAGDLAAATEAAATAVQLVPDDPLGWFNLGQILYVRGSFADAAAVLEQAVARAGDYSNALYYLSASYVQLGRTSDAIVALERVAALNPGEPAVRDSLAQLRAGQNPFAANASED